MGMHHWQSRDGGAQNKKTKTSGKDSVIEGQPLLLFMYTQLYKYVIIKNAQKRVLYQGMLFNCQLRL
jgi:hypothetical protein